MDPRRSSKKNASVSPAPAAHRRHSLHLSQRLSHGGCCVHGTWEWDRTRARESGGHHNAAHYTPHAARWPPRPRHRVAGSSTVSQCRHAPATILGVSKVDAMTRAARGTDVGLFDIQSEAPVWSEQTCAAQSLNGERSVVGRKSLSLEKLDAPVGTFAPFALLRSPGATRAGDPHQAFARCAGPHSVSHQWPLVPLLGVGTGECRRSRVGQLRNLQDLPSSLASHLRTFNVQRSTISSASVGSRTVGESGGYHDRWAAVDAGGRSEI
ncbi:hypothetical protein C8Q76DRAFT_58220 [Earliella scabrosa]|nr:hypothetical protein C8Q76DRAFT_58220 [Earliella scabrosa]